MRRNGANLVKQRFNWVKIHKNGLTFAVRKAIIFCDGLQRVSPHEIFEDDVVLDKPGEAGLEKEEFSHQ